MTYPTLCLPRKKYSSLIFKNIFPAGIFAKQAGNGSIWFNDHRSNLVVVQNHPPIGFAIVDNEIMFNESIPINVGAAIDIDSILWIEIPDQVTTPVILVVDRLGQVL